MARRFLLSTVLVAGGFVAGLVVTGRMRTAGDSAAQPRREPASRSASQHAAPAAAAVAAGTPDFTRIAAAAVKGVANISSLQIVRRDRSEERRVGKESRYR